MKEWQDVLEWTHLENPCPWKNVCPVQEAEGEHRLLLLNTKQIVISRGGLNCWGCKMVEEMLMVKRLITKAVCGSKLLTNEISKKNIFFYLTSIHFSLF